MLGILNILALTNCTVILTFYNNSNNPILDASPVSMAHNLSLLVELNESGKKINLLFTMKNHGYATNLNMVQDPCELSLNRLFSGKKGMINFCNRTVQFEHNNYIYNIEYGKSLVKYAIPIKTEFSKTPKLDETLSKEFSIGLVVFNDQERFKKHGNNINIQTHRIFKIVKDIYEKTIISPVIKEILNLNESSTSMFPNDGKNILESFKSLVDPTRFSPYNLKKELSKADLVLLLKTGKKKEHQGMSYFGGSTRLDASYSVVLVSDTDTEYYIAKKIAHEIAHSLGVKHDINQGFLMESKTCSTCSEDIREFGIDSLNQMNKFVRKNKRVFQRLSKFKYKDDSVLIKLEDAESYVNERRKHDFEDIINYRLQGHVPVHEESTIYLNLSLFFYGLIIIIAIVSIK